MITVCQQTLSRVASTYLQRVVPASRRSRLPRRSDSLHAYPSSVSWSFSTGIRNFSPSSCTFQDLDFIEEEDILEEGDIMSATRSISATSSTDKKRKRPPPAYFAVRKGRKPGIYFSWADTQEQIKEFSGAEYKKFASYTDAEAFLHSPSSAMSSKPKASPEKWYGVQVGHKPGVYTDYEEVKRQIRGYPGSKQQRFSTREEAQAFVEARDGGSSTPLNAANTASAAPSIKEDLASEISLRPSMATTMRKTPKAADSTTKKQKKNDGTPAAVYLPNGEIEPGTGPLPEDAEDGFDRTIKLNPKTGTIEYKTEEELSARKWQPTGDISRPITVYTDGAAPKNGFAGAVAGIGVYFGPGNPNNVSAPLGPGKQTNQRAELAAIKRAVDIVPINATALIYSDSNYAIKCITEWSRRWEMNDWKTASGKNVDNRDLIEPILERIREREIAGAKTSFEWVKGHGTNEGNIEADRLAVRGAEMGKRLGPERAVQEAAAAAAAEKEKEEGLEQVGEDDEWAFIKTLQEHERAAGGA